MDVGLGENAFMIGLFLQHPDRGGDYNVPCARFGNVAMLSNLHAVPRWGSYSCPAHLIDMRSRTGFSGSPVFVYRTASDHLEMAQVAQAAQASRKMQKPITKDGRLIVREASRQKEVMFWRFLGIHCGQFNERIKVQRAKHASTEAIELTDFEPTEAGQLIGTGDDLVIPSGMTIVTPSWRIEELLQLEVFEHFRREARDARRGRAPTR